MAVMNIFSDDAFSMASMTEAVETLDYEQGLLERIGLFEESTTPMDTDVLTFDDRDLASLYYRTGPLGKPSDGVERNSKPKSWSFKAPVIDEVDWIEEDEVVGKRKFGTGMVAAIQDMVLDNGERMLQGVKNTLEQHRFGALQGIIKEPVGAADTVFDWATELNSPQTEFALKLATATTDVRKMLEVDLEETLKTQLGGVGYNGLVAICDPTFYGNLISHAKVRDTYLNWQDAARARENTRGVFEYAGITFYKYQLPTGVNNTFDETNRAYLVPRIPGMLKIEYAPVGMIDEQLGMGPGGKLMFKQKLQDGRVKLHLKTRPIVINKRPGAVIRLTGENS